MSQHSFKHIFNERQQKKKIRKISDKRRSEGQTGHENKIIFTTQDENH